MEAMFACCTTWSPGRRPGPPSSRNGSRSRATGLPPSAPCSTRAPSQRCSGNNIPMPTFELTQVIDCPVGDVFATVVHIERFPEWSPRNHRSARRLSDGKIGEGARFEIEIKGFGKVIQTLEEFELNHRVRIVPHIKMLEGGHRFIFTAQGNSTRIDHQLAMRPKGIVKLLTPVM